MISSFVWMKIVVVSDNVAGMLFCEHVSTIDECKIWVEKSMNGRWMKNKDEKNCEWKFGWTNEIMKDAWMRDESQMNEDEDERWMSGKT
jgi:hypothetical protein